MLQAEQIRETNLDNGLKLLTVRAPTSPTLSVALCYRAGSRFERGGITGISHVLEHLMFKGTPRHPQGSFDRILQEQGMTYNAFTSRDYAIYHESMASDRYEIALELEADRMRDLAFTEESFAAEMAVIREERRQTVEDSPLGLLSESVEAAVYQAHPYHGPVIGWMEDLLRLRLEEVEAYYRERYCPNHAVLVMAGDLEHEKALASVFRHFGSIPSGPQSSDPVSGEPVQRGERSVTVEKEVQLPGIILAYRCGDATSREARVLNVIEFLLLHGRSSRLFRSMVYENQLATALGGGLQLRAGPGVFRLQSMARPGVEVADVLSTIEAELSDLATRPVGEEELSKVRRCIESDYLFSQEGHLEVALNLGEDECRHSWRDYLSWAEECRSVTAEEVCEVASRVLQPRNRTVGHLVPVSETGSGAQRGPQPEPGRLGASHGSPTRRRESA